MKTYVQYGCGHSVGRNWLNFDNSPTLRLEQMPVLGRFIPWLVGNDRSFPKYVRYGDICKGLPVAPGSVNGVYASHVLEHLTLGEFRIALRNTYSILKSGGVFRLVVPDLQARARLYLNAVAAGELDPASKFMRSLHLGMEQRPRSLIGMARSIFGGSAHLWMWDEPSISAHLLEAGFTNVRRCRMGDSGDPMFSEVEERERFFDTGLGIDELAMSAEKL